MPMYTHSLIMELSLLNNTSFHFIIYVYVDVDSELSINEPIITKKESLFSAIS